jgi:prepilin-type processing-associated H-X9-DG protein
VKQVACQSNLRQLAVAWHNYLQDNRGYFLQDLDAEVNYGGKMGQQKPKGGKPLNRYVGLPKEIYQGAEVFHCPADGGGGKVERHFDKHGTSYAMNQLLVGPRQLYYSRLDPCYRMLSSLNIRRRDLNRSKITVSESKLLLMGDYGWLPAWQVASTERIEWHRRPYRHNIAFMDGHADFVRIAKGLYVTSDYTVVPFADTASEIVRTQKPVPQK